jgi:predicted nuclease with RNAse H fold
MLFTDTTYVGIDPTSGRKTFTYAALDRDLNLVALADGEMEEVMTFLAAQKSATVAINAPAGANRGLVRVKIKKEMLTKQQVRGAEYRMAEFILREHGIAVSGTPASAAVCPAWMQVGFELYRKLGNLGFKKYPDAESTHKFLETHPQAGFCVLLNDTPLPKPTIEGRLQRQLLLYELGLRIKDPMDFFEEITRHKMLKGIWPVELLYRPEQLDALVAAFTAWRAAYKSEQVISIGDEKEGMIVLPEKELKEKY